MQKTKQLQDGSVIFRYNGISSIVYRLRYKAGFRLRRHWSEGMENGQKDMRKQ